jgi:transcriptional regulator with GAF, ATPase, and Fis domain
VRELENALERAVGLSVGTIETENLRADDLQVCKRQALTMFVSRKIRRLSPGGG